MARKMAVALLMLSACGDIINDPLRKGDLQGRVLRADESFGRVVLMGVNPLHADLDDDGSFHFQSIPSGAYQLLVVANPTEALLVPVTVGGGDLTDLQDIDPLPAGFVTINLTTSRAVEECSARVHLTDLENVQAPAGTARFVVGPLGARADGPGSYDVSLVYDGSAFWTQADLELDAGEQETYDVTW